MHISITDWHWKVAVKRRKETRLQVLHWNILHNIYPKNILLNRLGIVESKYCKYCKNEIDYIEHFFFWYCDSINTIWKRVEEYVGLKCNTTIKLKLTDALLGYSGLKNNSEVQLVINHVILIAKMCISKFKYSTYFNLLLLFEKEVNLPPPKKTTTKTREKERKICRRMRVNFLLGRATKCVL